MSGTKAGGIKARETNKKNNGEDFYARIGRKGGKNGHTGGFYGNSELAREAGKKGGKVSRRTKQERDEDGWTINKDGSKHGEGKYAKRNGLLKRVLGGK